jgi:opacity protein-like surface antigen
MKKFLLIIVCIIASSCNTNSEEAAAQQVIIDKVSASETYKNYVAAYNDYVSCKQERPTLTQQYMDKQITDVEFKEALTRNGKMCTIKKDIFNRYYRLLQAEFDKEAAAYEIKEE